MSQTTPIPQNDTPRDASAQASESTASTPKVDASSTPEPASMDKKPEEKAPTAPAAVPASTPSPSPSPSSSAGAKAQKPAPGEVRQGGGRAGIWLVMLALAVAGLAFVVSALLWQRFDQMQQEIARRSQDSAANALDARAMASQAEALAKELQARLTVAEVRLSEVSLQRSQLEELMLTLSRSRDDNLVQDIESALRLGQQQSQLTGSVQPLLSALQAADQRIARAAQPRLNPVQRAIARDIERIQGAALADLPSLVLRLDELARQVDEWPVANEVGPLAGSVHNGKPVAVPPRRTGSEPVPSDSVSEGTTAMVVPGSESGEAQTAVAAGWGLDYWRALWSRAWADASRSGRDLVRVSRIDTPEAALLAPEQAFFLRENVKLKLLNARLGLLARQLSSSQADVKSVETSLLRYFDTSAPLVAGAQASLSKLRDELVVTDIPRPEESLAALATAAGGR